MVDQVDTIATELTLRYAQYVSGVDTVVQTNKRLNKSIADLSKLGVEAPPQYANAAASAASKGAEAHEKAAARIKTARKATVDTVKQSGSEEIAAEIATQQRLTKAVEDGITARSNAVRRGSGTVIGSTVPGRANNARQGLLTGTSVDAVATADVAAEREINSLALDTYDLEQKRKVLTGARLADVERELELQRRITVYEREGLTTEEAQVRAEARMVEMETLRAEKEAELALARKSGGSRSGFGGANEFALQASGGKFGYSFSPGALAGVAVAAGVGVGIEAVSSATQYAKALTDVSKAAGISAEALQVYQRAAINAGAKSTDFDQAIGELSNNLGKARTGAETQSKAFAALGIDIKGAASAGDLMPTLIDRISSIADQSKRAAIETALFGESGRKLDGLLAGGNAQINALAKALQDTGSILSSSDIAKLDDVSKKLEAVKAQLQVDVAETVAGNADAIERLAGAFASLVDKIGAAITIYDKFENSPIGKGISALNNYDPTQLAARGLGRLFTGKGSTATQVGQSGNSVNLALGDDVQPGKVNNALLNSFNAPKGRKGPNPNTALNEADQRTKRFNDAMARYQDEILAATAQQTSDEEARRDIEREQLRRDEARQIADLKTQADIDKRKAPKDAGLIDDRLQQQIKALQDVTAEKLSKVNLDSTLSAITRQNEADNAILEFKNQQLQAQEQLAKTAAERRDLELQILANEQQIAKNNANSVFNRKAEGDPTITKADVNAAQRTLDNLPADTASKTAAINKQTQGPLASYLDSLPRSAKQVDEAFQDAAVHGIQSFNSELGDSVSKMLHLHGIAGQLIEDIVQIGIKWAEAQLFGTGTSGAPGAGGSGLGGLGKLIGGLGKLFGIGGASSGIGSSIGGSFLTDNSILGAGSSTFIDPSLLALPGLAGGGTFQVNGRGGVDTNVVSINGTPKLRLNSGETVGVVPKRVDSQSASTTLVVQPIHADFTGARTDEQTMQKFQAYADAKSAQAAQVAISVSGRQAPGAVRQKQTLEG